LFFFKQKCILPPKPSNLATGLVTTAASASHLQQKSSTIEDESLASQIRIQPQLAAAVADASRRPGAGDNAFQRGGTKSGPVTVPAGQHYLHFLM